MGALTVQGSSDDDTLTVDESGGLITLPGGIHYDGGAGFGSLAFTNNGGPALATTSMTPGPGKGGGTIVHGDGTGTQTVVYNNLEPVTDTSDGRQQDRDRLRRCRARQGAEALIHAVGAARRAAPTAPQPMPPNAAQSTQPRRMSATVRAKTR